MYLDIKPTIKFAIRILEEAAKSIDEENPHQTVNDIYRAGNSLIGAAWLSEEHGSVGSMSLLSILGVTLRAIAHDVEQWTLINNLLIALRDTLADGPASENESPISF